MLIRFSKFCVRDKTSHGVIRPRRHERSERRKLGGRGVVYEVVDEKGHGRDAFDVFSCFWGHRFIRSTSRNVPLT